MKKCSKCNEEKELSGFNKDKAKKDGVRSDCRECCREYNQKNKNKINAQHKIYRDNNKDYLKEYRIKNREELCKYSNKYYLDNKDTNKEKYNNLSLEEQELIRQKRLNYYSNNKEKAKGYREKYYSNPSKRENQRIYSRNYIKNKRKNDPEFKMIEGLRNCNRHHLNRTNKKDKSPFSKIVQLFEIQNYECIYCKVNISESKHIDHVVPISKGGSNLIINIVLACPHCNLSKSNKDLHIWLKEIGANYFQFINNLEARNSTFFPDELSKFHRQQYGDIEQLSDSNQEFIQQCLSNYLEKLNAESK